MGGGGYVVAGAYRDDENGLWSASDYIFERPLDGEWVTTNSFQTKLSLFEAMDEYGVAVATN